MRAKKLFAQVFIYVLFFFSCNHDEDFMQENADLLSRIPVIENFNPLSGKPGSKITVSGKNLKTVKSIMLDKVDVPFEIESSSILFLRVPEDVNFSNSSQLTFMTDTHSVISKKTFNVIDSKTAEITEILPKSATSRSTITLKGINLGSITEVAINGVVSPTLEIISNEEMRVELGEDLPVGLAEIQLTNSEGIFTIRNLEFYIIEYLFPDFNEDWDDKLENILWTPAEDFENDIEKSGFSTEIEPYTLLPNPVSGRFCTIGGVSDVTDSGSYCGQIRMMPQPEGTFNDFFKNANQDLDTYFFNVQINFQGVPTDYPLDDPLAGFRVRFEYAYIDTDGDGFRSDQYMEYRPTLEELEKREYVSNPDGWYSISIPFSSFLNAGENGGNWDSYNLEQNVTRFTVASRRNHNGPFSMSIDNFSITKGGPVYFSNYNDHILSNKH